jgi:hypothetical protein
MTAKRQRRLSTGTGTLPFDSFKKRVQCPVRARAEQNGNPYN